MRFVQGSQPLGDLPRMIEDGSRKAIVARKSGLLLGTDIAKLVGKDGVWQAAGGPAVEPSCLEVRKRDASGCGTLDKPPTTRQHHAAISLLCSLSAFAYSVSHFWISLEHSFCSK